MRYLHLFMLLLLIGCLHTAADPIIWIEGERPTEQAHIVTNDGFNAVSPWALSGGSWLHSFSEEFHPETGEAAYRINIPQAGTYRLWARLAGSAADYRLDAGEWISIDMSRGVDPRRTAADGGWGWPPLIHWYELGAHSFASGKHVIRFRLGGPAGGKRFAGLDCLVLTTGSFTPNGKYKPEDKAPQPVEDVPASKGWVFDPKPDTLDPGALLDLRRLNERTAGEHGFIGRSRDGNSFVTLGNGKPIRFWGGAEYNQRDMNFDELKRYAQFLAKRGINIVRAHTHLEPKGADSQVTDVDEEELDRIFKLVAAMKTAGIYTVISPFWGTSARVQPNWGVMATPGSSCEPLLFIDPVLQRGYKAWLKALYTRPNPYSGVKLADEPAVAIIQIQNENSLLFWTFANMSPEAMTHFRRLFASWLIKKYGSLEQAQKAWKDYNPPGGEMWIHADWANGLPPVSHPWDFTREGLTKKAAWPGFIEYTSDLLEFMARTMYSFNAEIATYLRKELGCRQLINAGNWRGVDPVTQQDVEYWSYTANEVIGRNMYFTGVHIGPNDGWQILANDFYTDISALTNPTSIPISLKQPAGHPFILSETLWVPPSLYQSESAPLVAAQTALTGLDVVFWFADGDGYWGGLRPQTKWSFAHPMNLGQFPAAALIFRQGLVREGEPALVENRPLSALWARRTPLIAEEAGWDPNRDTTNVPGQTSAQTLMDPLAFWVGPVRISYDGKPEQSVKRDMSPYIDRTRKQVRSITGETSLDYGKGIYRIDSPRAQGALGFLREAGVQRLKDVTITCRNRYASIVAVPLDGRPIRQSGQVLIQVGTLARPSGWKSAPDRFGTADKPVDCRRLISFGSAPYLIERTDATVTIMNRNLKRAVALDANGLAKGAPLTLQRNAAGVTLRLPADALYVVLTAAH